MDLERSHILLEITMKENGLLTKNKDKEQCTGLMLTKK